ncbi:hypothetical protein OBBRIDRAFT_831914 [Obba rivulosa]|uniref:Uncharacterized protein n=1 Tax=Obba rivulosa TaxID=1052685 RepID=A0A8E2DRC7_9APHY|nr:hypothetical protein OBBRIDRAFT_831914 [Obba rivulosa]
MYGGKKDLRSTASASAAEEGEREGKLIFAWTGQLERGPATTPDCEGRFKLPNGGSSRTGPPSPPAARPARQHRARPGQGQAGKFIPEPERSTHAYARPTVGSPALESTRGRRGRRQTAAQSAMAHSVDAVLDAGDQRACAVQALQHQQSLIRRRSTAPHCWDLSLSTYQTVRYN